MSISPENQAPETGPEKLDPLGLELAQTVLIEASAGTGKTYTITTLVSRLIAQGYPLESILVVTFTDAAAAELKVRIRKRLAQCLAGLEASVPEEGAPQDDLVAHLLEMEAQDKVKQRLSYAVTAFDQACIATIHSFCSLMLKSHSFESGARFEMELVTDNSAFFHQVCMDFFMTRINSLDPLFLNFLALRGITPENWGAAFKQLVAKPQLRRIPETAAFEPVWDDYREVTNRIREMLETRMQEICDTVLQKTSTVGLNGSAYRKDHVPKWLEATVGRLKQQGKNAFFEMSEKGDPLFKFTTGRMAGKTAKGKGAPSHEFFLLCDRLTLHYQAMETNLIHLKLAFLDFYDRELDKLKTGQGQCFFDDLINDLANALAPDSPDREGLITAAHTTYQACLIDEFQDTDPRQYGIFSTLFKGENRTTGRPMPFFMIGDPKQAIYAFRGGDIFAYLEAADACDAAYTLDKNYRSSPLMVQGVNHVFGFPDSAFLFDRIQFTRVGTPENHQNRLVQGGEPIAPFQFCCLEESQGMKAGQARSVIADLLVKQIMDDLDSGMMLHPLNTESGDPPRSLHLGDMAVLVRSHSQADAVKAALARAGIPAYMSKTGSVYDTVQARELYDILRAVQEPSRAEGIRGALCTSVFGFRPQDIDPGDEAFTGAWQERFMAWKEIWEKRGFVFMLQDLLYSEAALLRPYCCVDDRGMTNFHHLMELISQAALGRHLSMFFLMKWFKHQVAGGAQGDAAHELRLESDGRAVAIVTIHKSKGLEYPLVYLPYLWSKPGAVQAGQAVLFHDPEDGDRPCIDFRGREERQASVDCLTLEDQAEMRRLLYVALTRASALCRVYWCDVDGAEKSALGQMLCRDLRFKGSAAEKRGQARETLAQAMSQLAQGSRVDDREAIGVVSVAAAETLSAYEPEATEVPELFLRPLPEKVEPAFRISSFSSLTRGMGGEVHGLNGQGVSPALSPELAKREIVLANFPKGAGAGEFFHGVLEEMDFTGPGRELNQWVDRKLTQFGFKGQGLGTMSRTAFRDMLATPLDDGDAAFALNDVQREDCFRELSFYFSAVRFRLKRLAQCFTAHDGTRAYGEFLARAADGDGPAFTGFFKGFVDLIVHHRGKWYILDYKSNFLGRTYGDYSPGAVTQAMVSHHYILQYHLYLVALDRYLGYRLDDYEYDRDFGGVFYLFLRGMHPDAGQNGIYFSRPGKELVSEMAMVLGE